MGEESLESKGQPLPPVEESAASAGTLNRKDPSDNTANVEFQQTLKTDSSAAESVGLESKSDFNEEVYSASGSGEKKAKSADNEQGSANKPGLQVLTEEEQKVVESLAARDREVRSHERAHASVGGQIAGPASYTFKRGPDGVSYAIGGEVSISVGAVSGDPEATIRKAQQVQQAALAPADPSPADRQIAASAAQLALEARAELLQQGVEERETEREASAQQAEEAKNSEEALNEGEEAKEQEELRSDEQLSESGQRNSDVNRRLLDISATDDTPTVGGVLDQLI